MSDKEEKDQDGEEYYKPPSAMTLSQRKGQPQVSAGGSNPRDQRGQSKAKKANPPPVEEYSEAWLQWKVREEIGFD